MSTLVSEENYADGQIIFNAGSSGDWVYVVVSGSVEVCKIIGEKKFVIEVLKEGEVFGELSFMGGIKRTATVIAVGETTIGIIDRNSLDQEYNKLSSDFRAILVAVARRFKKMVDRVTEFSARTEPRIAKTLSVSYKDQQSFLKAYTGNISNGGLFLKTGNPFPKGELFLLRLQLPGLPEPLKIKAEVAWVNSKERENDKLPPGMGVKFLEMSKKENQTLQEYIKSLMKN